MQSMLDIVSILRRCGINTDIKSNYSELFERNIRFNIRKVAYRIEWYTNVATLSVGGEYENYIQFDELQPNNTWSSYDNGLIILKDKKPVMYIAINKLDWQE